MNMQIIGYIWRRAGWHIIPDGEWIKINDHWHCIKTIMQENPPSDEVKASPYFIDCTPLYKLEQ